MLYAQRSRYKVCLRARAGDLQMDEANELFAAHGENSVSLLKAQISEALAAGNEANALHLDELLQIVEALVGAGPNMGDEGQKGPPTL